MNAQPAVWAPLPGFDAAYEVELHSGRCRSVDRPQVIAGRRRQLRGRELKQCGPASTVSLSCRGVRRSFTPAVLIAMAEAGA